ncbi:MAG: OmpA family protein [Acidobacteriaceae bacterium]|nr:OmpA family protein [Acidobacteriaceae bacterium]
MKQVALITGLVLVLAGFALIDYRGYQSLKRVENQTISLGRQVDEATRLAREESSAATAASHRADEAAAQAQVAAGARRQAEEQKQQAEQGQAQAQSAAQQATQQAQEAQDELSRIRREREQELNRMQEALNRVVETRRTPQGMTIILPDSTFRFDFDSADLSQKNRELLSRIAGILLVSKGYGLSVFGYTDDVGTEDYNRQLSVRRATSVEQYLIQAGIDSSIINLKGYGKTSPMVPGTSASARAKNRRVEIALTDSEIKYGGEAPSSAH